MQEEVKVTRGVVVGEDARRETADGAKSAARGKVTRHSDRQDRKGNDGKKGENRKYMKGSEGVS